MYFRNTGSTDWGLATNWSTTDGGPADGAVPTSTDDANFTVNSGACTIATTARTCRNLVFTNAYAQTFTINANLTISNVGATAVTLGTGVTITGSAFLIISTTGVTLTANGITWGAGLRLTGSNGNTQTLADNWTVNHLDWSLNKSLNGNKIFIVNSLGQSAGSSSISGTTSIECIGAVTWSAGRISNNLEWKCGVNTFTITGSVMYGVNTMTYTSGTPVTTGSTLSITNACTLNTSGIIWDNVNITTANATITLSSQLKGNSLVCGTTSSFTTVLAGSGGIDFNHISFTGAIGNLRLANGTTNTIHSSFSNIQGNVNHITSITGAILTLDIGASQDLYHMDGTNIDSSGGETIYVNQDATISGTTNWNKRTGFHPFFND